jgi:hypothetical protein
MTKVMDISDKLTKSKSELDRAYSAIVNSVTPLQIEEYALEFSSALKGVKENDQKAIDRTVHAIDHIYALMRKGGKQRDLEALNHAGRTLGTAYTKQFVDYKKH